MGELLWQVVGVGESPAARISRMRQIWRQQEHLERRMERGGWQPGQGRVGRAPLAMEGRGRGGRA